MTSTHDIIKVRQFSEETLNDFPSTPNEYPFVKMGDFAIAKDTGKTYICSAVSPAVAWTQVGGAVVGGEAFPIGSVFISVVATDPADLLGYGTWASIGAGKTLVGLDSGDTDFDTVEETGGSKTNTPSAHSGAAVADHAAKNTDQAGVGATQRGTTTSTLTLKAHVHNISAYVHSVTQPDNHSALSVVQPYIVVYFWKRTA